MFGYRMALSDGTSFIIVRRGVVMPSLPGDKSNRRGCLIIAIIVALFIAVYLLVGLNAKRENSVASKIQVAPEGQR